LLIASFAFSNARRVPTVDAIFFVAGFGCPRLGF